VMRFLAEFNPKSMRVISDIACKFHVAVCL